MSKKLNEAAMQSELSGSAFFQSPTDKGAVTPEPETGESVDSGATPASHYEAKVASNQTIQTETKQPSNLGAAQPGSQEILLEIVRLAVKELGRVAGTHRYTQEEKQTLEELVYDYGRKGIKTSGNEIIRIGLNFLFEDYRLLGKSSILARVLERLNA